MFANSKTIKIYCNNLNIDILPDFPPWFNISGKSWTVSVEHHRIRNCDKRASLLQRKFIAQTAKFVLNLLWNEAMHKRTSKQPHPCQVSSVVCVNKKYLMRHTTSLLSKERCGILCGTCEQDFFDSKQAANLSFLRTSNFFFAITSHLLARCYRTFYGRNLLLFIISACPWQAFPSLCNVWEQG